MAIYRLVIQNSSDELLALVLSAKSLKKARALAEPSLANDETIVAADVRTGQGWISLSGESSSLTNLKEHPNSSRKHPFGGPSQPREGSQGQFVSVAAGAGSIDQTNSAYSGSATYQTPEPPALTVIFWLLGGLVIVLGFMTINSGFGLGELPDITKVTLAIECGGGALMLIAFGSALRYLHRSAVANETMCRLLSAKER